MEVKRVYSSQLILYTYSYKTMDFAHDFNQNKTAKLLILKAVIVCNLESSILGRQRLSVQMRISGTTSNFLLWRPAQE